MTAAARGPDAGQQQIGDRRHESRSGCADRCQGERQRGWTRNGGRRVEGFAESFAEDRNVEKVYLSGDFNSNSKEDPVQVLEEAGYTALESTDDPNEKTYNFDGQIQSLDHIFANEAAVLARRGRRSTQRTPRHPRPGNRGQASRCGCPACES
jgi:predicted extracellular nuclease